MAGVDFVFNIARGQIKTFYSNVDTDTPTGCRFAVVLIETTSIEADATLRDYDDLAALIAGTSNEQTNQARKFLVDADLAEMPAPDDTNDRMDLDLPDLTYTALGGNAVGKVLVCYKPASGSADSAIIPMTAHAVSITPDGNDVVLQIAAAGFWRSQ
jgi:hypothetical protein